MTRMVADRIVPQGYFNQCTVSQNLASVEVPLLPPQLHFGEGCVQGRGIGSFAGCLPHRGNTNLLFISIQQSPQGCYSDTKRIYGDEQTLAILVPQRLYESGPWLLYPSRKKLSLSLHLTFCTHLYSRFFCYKFIARSYMKVGKHLQTLNIITSKPRARKNMLPPINVL